MQYRITYVRQGRNKLKRVDVGGKPEAALDAIKEKYPDSIQHKIWQEYTPKPAKAAKPVKKTAKVK